MQRKGFSLVELLVVLIIIAILAAVATPIYLRHTQRAKVAEAVSTMSLIRQELRDYWARTNAFFSIAVTGDDTGNIQNALPTSVASDTTPTPATAGVSIDVGIPQYFSNGAFTVDASSPASTRFTNPGPVDFLVTTIGSDSRSCGEDVSTNCAIRAADVAGYQLEMDNSGRIFVCYGSCGTATNWNPY